MKKVLPLLLLLLCSLPAKAKDIYVTQNQTGNASGSSCGNARNAAWFNNRANWGSGSAQIGPGTTVHLCGKFVGAPGQQMLLVRGSGTAGHPITLKLETGALFTAPYWSSQGAIYADGVSYLTIDGSNSAVIENTDNGTGRRYQQNSRAIYAPNCNNCSVLHLTMQNLYVRTSNADLRPTQTDLNCVHWNNSNNFTISYTTCHDAGWAYPGYGNNFSLSFSWIYNVDHGVAFGAAGTKSGFSIHDNHIWNYTNWDSPTNAYHHDGIHIWGQNGGRVTNGAIYNNRFDGDSGVNITAHIYLQDSIQNVAVYNNVFVVPSNRTLVVLWFAAGTTNLPGGPATGNSAYNNFISGGAHTHGAALFIQGQQNFTAVNNVLIGGNSDISVAFGGSLSSTGINHNVYVDLNLLSGSMNTFGYQGRNYHTLADWQNACRCDRNSKMIALSALKANSAGQLLSGSPGIAAGSNLMNISIGSLLALAKDVIGTTRPNSNSWDAGAYQTINGAPRPLAPSGVTATVN